MSLRELCWREMSNELPRTVLARVFAVSEANEDNSCPLMQHYGIKVGGINGHELSRPAAIEHSRQRSSRKRQRSSRKRQRSLRRQQRG